MRLVAVDAWLLECNMFKYSNVFHSHTLEDFLALLFVTPDTLEVRSVLQSHKLLLLLLDAPVVVVILERVCLLVVVVQRMGIASADLPILVQEIENLRNFENYECTAEMLEQTRMHAFSLVLVGWLVRWFVR